MGQHIEAHSDILPEGYLRVLELGSGTGLGGVHISKYLAKRGLEFELMMTDICEKSLKVIDRNLTNNGVAGTKLQ